MPDLSSITLPNNTTYDLKDDYARTHNNVELFYADITWTSSNSGNGILYDSDSARISSSIILENIDDGNLPIIVFNDYNSNATYLHLKSIGDNDSVIFDGYYNESEHFIAEVNDNAVITIDIYTIPALPIMPISNYTGKVLMINSSRQAEWSDLPVYDGGVS